VPWRSPQSRDSPRSPNTVLAVPIQPPPHSRDCYDRGDDHFILQQHDSLLFDEVNDVRVIGLITVTGLLAIVIIGMEWESRVSVPPGSPPLPTRSESQGGPQFKGRELWPQIVIGFKYFVLWNESPLEKLVIHRSTLNCMVWLCDWAVQSLLFETNICPANCLVFFS